MTQIHGYTDTYIESESGGMQTHAYVNRRELIQRQQHINKAAMKDTRAFECKIFPIQIKNTRKHCKHIHSRAKTHTRVQTNTHLRETVRLRHIQKLESLHLETKGAVNQQQHQIGRFGDVAHCIEVVRALEDREAPLLAWPGQCQMQVNGNRRQRIGWLSNNTFASFLMHGKNIA
jgi:hypothetical protein